MLFFLLLLFCLLVGLFAVFVLSKDDFVLMRKNMILEEIFNLSLLLFFGGLLTARLGYVWQNPSTGFLNPLVFFLFPYFPGLSLAGGVMGAVILLLVLTQNKKMPSARIFDLLSLSLLLSVGVGTVLIAIPNLFTNNLNGFVKLITGILYLAFFCLVFLWHQQGKFKDGINTLIILIFFPLFSIISNVLTGLYSLNPLLFLKEDLLLAVILLVALAILGKKQKWFKFRPSQGKLRRFN